MIEKRVLALPVVVIDQLEEAMEPAHRYYDPAGHLLLWVPGVALTVISEEQLRQEQLEAVEDA